MIRWSLTAGIFAVVALAAPLGAACIAGYSGPLNYAAFRREVESYYRDLIGPTSRMLSFSPGVGGLRMRNHALKAARTVECDNDDEGGGW